MGYMLTTDMDMDDIDAIHLRNQAAQAQHAYRLGPSLEADLPPLCSSGRSSPVPDDLCSLPSGAPPFSTPEHLEIALRESDPFSPLPSGPVPISPELSPLQATFPRHPPPPPPVGPLSSPFATGSIRRAADTARSGGIAPPPGLGLAPPTVPLPADPELLPFRRATFNATPSVSSCTLLTGYCLCRRCNVHAAPGASAAAAQLSPGTSIPGPPVTTTPHHHHCVCTSACRFPTPADIAAAEQEAREAEARRERVWRGLPPPLAPPPGLPPRAMSLDTGAPAARVGNAAPVGFSGAAGGHHWHVAPSPPVSMFEFDSDEEDEDDDEEQLDSESEAELLSWGS